MHDNFFVPKLQHFLSFQVYLIVNQMTSLLVFNNSYPVIPTSSKGKESDKLLYDGSVTRYGPRNQLPAQGVNTARKLFAPREIFFLITLSLSFKFPSLSSVCEISSSINLRMKIETEMKFSPKWQSQSAMIKVR